MLWLPLKRFSGSHCSFSAASRSYFPPLKPSGSSSEAIRAHRKQVQAYMMESWEKRLEEQTGADEVRAQLAKGLAAKRHVLREAERALHQNLSAEHSAERLKKLYPSTYRRVMNPYDKQMKEIEGLIDDVIVEYNTRMQRPLGAEIPTYRWLA